MSGSSSKQETYHVGDNVKWIIFKWEFRIHIQVLHNVLCQNLNEEKLQEG